MTAAQTSLVTITREWNWGVVAVVDTDPDSELPDEVDADRPVTAGRRALVVAIRHAQDAVDGGPTQAVVVVRRWSDAGGPALDGAQLLSDTVIGTPSGALDIGDADEWYRVPTHSARTRVVVSVAEDEDPQAADAVVLDLLPAPSI